MNPGQSPGELTVGASQSRLTDTSVVTSEIGGNLPGAQFDILNFAGGLELGGLLALDLIDGFTPEAGSSFELVNTSDISGAFSVIETNPEQGSENVWTFDIRPEVVLASVAASAIDMSVANVSAPATTAPGQATTIAWEVTNNGTLATPDSFVDRIFISPNPEFDIRNSQLVGTRTATTSIAPGQTQQFSQTVTSPPFVGQFFYHIVSDSQQSIADLNRGNNIGCANSATIFEPVRVDSVDSPVTTTAVPGEEVVVAIDRSNLAGPATVAFSSQVPNSLVFNVHVSEPTVNSEPEFTQICEPNSEGRCELDIPDDAPNTLFFSVSFLETTGTPSFNVSLTQSEPNVTEVSPSVVPNAGSATITFSGSALPLGGTFRLVGNDGTTIDAENIVSRSSSQARVTFNFAGKPQQFYSFIHFEDGQQQNLCNECVGVEQSTRQADVFDASVPQFTFNLSTPNNVAALRESQVEVSITNTFGVDLSGRLVQVETDNGVFTETGTPQMLVFLGGASGNVIAPGETARTTISYVPTVGGEVNISAGLSTEGEEFEVATGPNGGIFRLLDLCLSNQEGGGQIRFEGDFSGLGADDITFEMFEKGGSDGSLSPVFTGSATIESDTTGSISVSDTVIAGVLVGGRFDIKFIIAGRKLLFKNAIEVKGGVDNRVSIERTDFFNAVPTGLFTQDERNFVADQASTSIGGRLYNLQSSWGRYNEGQVAAGFPPASTTGQFIPGFASNIVQSQLPQFKQLNVSEGNIVVDEILHRCITLDDLRGNPEFKIIVKGTGLAGIDNVRIDLPGAAADGNVLDGTFLPVNVLNDNTVEISFDSVAIERLLRNQDGTPGTRIALGTFDLTLGDGNNNTTSGPGFEKTIEQAIIIGASKSGDSQEPDNLRVANPASFGQGNLDTTHFGRTQVSPTINNFVLAGKDHFVLDVNGVLTSANPDIYTVAESNGEVIITTTTVDGVTVATTVDRETGALNEITNRNTGSIVRPTTNSAGRIITLVDGDNRVVERYLRNERQQITEITNDEGTTSLSYDGQLLESIASADKDVTLEYGPTPDSTLVRVSAVVANGTRFTLQYSESGEIDTITTTDTGEVFDFKNASPNLLAEILGTNGQVFRPDPNLGPAFGLLKGFAAPKGVRALIDGQQVLGKFSRDVAPTTTSSAIQTKTSSPPGSGQQVAPETHNAVVRGTVAANRSQRNSQATSQAVTDTLGRVTNAFGQFVKKTVSTVKNFAISTVSAAQSILASVLFSQDPNDILGPEGVGPLRHTTVDQSYGYTIRFENDSDATAPAQEVFISQTLDNDFDVNTFEFKSFGWSGVEFSLPTGAKEFTRTIDLQPQRNLAVRATGSFDPSTREVVWALRSLDPLTGSLPADALNGFLPPNNDSGVGEGFVSYGIDVRQDLTTGTRLDAEAAIVFDVNEPIITPPIFNTIDAGAPTATVDPLAPVTPTSEFAVSWSGTDDSGGSGIATFDIFVSTDGGPFEPFLLGTRDTTASFVGEDGKSYAFRAIATDNVGFVETDLGVAESTTTVQLNSAPIVNTPIADLTITEDASVQSFDLSEVFTDTDGDELSFVALSTNPALVAPTIQGNNLLLTFTADANGAATVTVTASDGELTASDTFIVTVDAVNDAPTVVNPIADVEVNEDVADQTIDLTGVFADVDSSDLTLAAVSSDGSLVATSLSGNQLTLSFAADQNGAATVTVTANDGELSASDTFNVTVNAVNDAPTVVNPIANVEVSEDAADQTIDLTGVFADIDSSDLTLAAVSSDGSLVTTSISGTFLKLSFTPGHTGAAIVTVTASDGESSISDSFDVTVSPTDNQPVQLSGGVLTITGDLGDQPKDRVYLEKQGRKIRVSIRQGSGDRQEFQFLNDDVDLVDVSLGDGNDVLFVSSNFRKPITVAGGQGNDWIETGRGDDTIIDSDGNNFISSGLGRDHITTGDGRDRIYAGAGRDFVRSGGGDDIVYAGDGADIVIGGAGHDWISGGSGRDLLIGGRGCDIMFGGDGQDLLIGGATVHDDNDEALQAIASEWTSGRSLTRRKANITDGSGSNNRRNGEYFLGAETLIDDHVSDLLFGGADDDWKL